MLQSNHLMLQRNQGTLQRNIRTLLKIMGIQIHLDKNANSQINQRAISQIATKTRSHEGSQSKLPDEVKDQHPLNKL